MKHRISIAILVTGLLVAGWWFLASRQKVRNDALSIKVALEREVLPDIRIRSGKWPLNFEIVRTQILRGSNTYAIMALQRNDVTLDVVTSEPTRFVASLRVTRVFTEEMSIDIDREDLEVFQSLQGNDN